MLNGWIFLLVSNNQTDNIVPTIVFKSIKFVMENKIATEDFLKKELFKVAISGENKESMQPKKFKNKHR